MRTILFAALLSLASAAAQAQGAPTVYHGACDGSAAVALDANHFVAANDDENSLRVYRIGKSESVAEIDLNPVLKPEKKDSGKPKEVDIEAAARIGDRIYWLASHARDSKGDEEISRQHFFATEISRTNGANAPSVLPPTRSYPHLLKHLIALLPELNSKDPPEEKEGFNIEGIAATPEGELLIGLRNPRPAGRAIVVRLADPGVIVADDRAVPQFGSTARLDLGGRGIRSIERIGDRYVIVAGPFGDGDNDFALYSWSGVAGTQPTAEAGLVVGSLKPEMLFNFKPESLFATANPGEVYLLSDDGTKSCKDLKDPRKKTFRGLAIRLAN